MKSEPLKILIADDEPDILEIINYNLSKEGYEVITASNGQEAIELAKKHNPDLIILDVMMPFKTGVEVCRDLRRLPQFEHTLIVYLTAVKDELTEITGLEAGADDYITKPISGKVLVSKVQSWMRRIEPSTEAILQVGNLSIDRERYIILKGDEEISLARKEFELLALLASKPGKVFLRHEILHRIWGTDVIVGDRTIDVHIRKIRQKLNLDNITTVKGVGYKFDIE